jgi:hypothetical protein
MADSIKLAEGNGLQGKFVQLRYLSGFAKPIRSEGAFFVLPGTGLVWQTLSPVSTLMEIDDEGIRQSVEGTEVSNISAERFPAIGILREALDSSLSGDWQQLEELSGTKLKKSGDNWSLNFIPDQANDKLPFTKVFFDVGTYLEKIEIFKQDGDKDIITFTDQKQATIGEIEAAARALKKEASR